MNIIKILIIGAVSTYIFFGVVIYFLQETLIFFPEVLGDRYQYTFDQPFEERNFQVDEKTRINAVHFRKPGSKGLIFYHHGNAGSLERWGDIAAYFVQYNYDVLVYDYRGFGKSTGKKSMSALYGDAQFIYEKLTEEYKEENMIIYGRSLGTAMATRVAADNSPGQLILETPFYSLSDVAIRHYPIYPHQYLLKYPFPSYRYIPKVKCPVTIIHGTKDELVDFKSGQKLFDKIKDRKDARMVVIEGGFHNDLIDFKEYRAAIGNILK